MKPSRRLFMTLAVILVTMVALLTRLRAADLLPIDYDEDGYLAASQHYALAIAAGDMSAIINYRFTYEHPPLAKIAYGLALLPLPETPLIREASPFFPPPSTLPQPHFHVARLLSVSFGVLDVTLLALLNPLAGLFLAIFSWQIKYTSQVMLESLPSLTSTLAVLCYVRGRRSQMSLAGGRLRWNHWMLFSAVALGLTAASKYTYCVVGVAILVDWLWANVQENRTDRTSTSSIVGIVPGLGAILLWGAMAMVIFVAADPYLWTNPFARLRQSLLYHHDFGISVLVQNAGMPIWQPVIWLTQSVPWHPDIFVVRLDLWITLLAVLGFRRLWSRQRVFALWLLIALGFLMIWPTKWPHYVLTLTTPLTLAAASGVQAFWEPGRTWYRYIRDHQGA